MIPTAILIDDSHVIRARLKIELARLGFQVMAKAATGELVMELYEKYRPTLMMLDIIMPGLDGVTAATQLLQKHPEATVVICSSLTARDKILACRDAGVKHFILKPFSSEGIAAMARKILAPYACEPRPAEE